MTVFASDIRAGGAVVELNLDDKTQPGLNKAQTRLRNFGKSLETIGGDLKSWSLKVSGVAAAVAAPFALSVAAATSAGSELTKLAAKTDISVEALSELRFAARLAGTDIATFAEKLAPAIKANTPLIAGFRAQAQQLGLTMSAGGAQAAHLYGAELLVLKDVVNNLAASVGIALLPQLRAATESLLGWAATAVTFVKNNQGMIAQVAKLVAIAGTAGTVLFAAGTSLGILGHVAAGLAGGLAAAGAAFAAIGTVLSAIATPIGLVTVGAIGIGVAILKATGLATQAVGVLSKGFSFLKDEALATFKGIKDAIVGGDFELAAKIGFSAIKLEFAKLESSWNDLTRFFTDVWTLATNSWADNLTVVVEHMRGIWSAFADYMADALKPVTTSMTSWFVWFSGEWKKFKLAGDPRSDSQEWFDEQVKQIDKKTADEQTFVPDAMRDNDIANKADREERDRKHQERLATRQAQFEADLAAQSAQNGAAPRGPHDQREAEIRAEIVDLTKKRDALLAGAKGKAGAGGAPAGDANPFDEKIAELMRQLNAPTDKAHDRAFGTFNATVAAQQVGGGNDVQTKILNEAKQSRWEQIRQRKVSERILRKIGKIPLVPT